MNFRVSGTTTSSANNTVSISTGSLTSGPSSATSLELSISTVLQGLTVQNVGVGQNLVVGKSYDGTGIIFKTISASNGITITSDGDNIYLQGGTLTSAMVIANNLVATGTNQATALLISAQINIFTSAPTGTGAVLPAINIYGNYRVINASGASLLVYPPGNAQIGTLAIRTPATIANNDTVDFVTTSPTSQWYAS